VIENPQAIKHCNEKGRVLADAMVTLYESARAYRADWDANGIGAVLPNTTEEVKDGAHTDGRPLMTGAKANALYAAAGAIVTWFEAGNPSRITQVRQIAVNGASRF
jgi:hypothetical protein